MSSIVTCYFPEALAPGVAGNRSEWARGQIASALSARLEPADISSIPLRRMSVSFDRGILAQIDDLARRRGVAPGRMAGQLLQAAHLAGRRGDAVCESRESGARTAAGSEADDAWRPEQLRLLSAVRPPLLQGRIVFAEGGAGVGKSRVIARLAREAFEREQAKPAALRQPIVIAVPTIVTLTHFVGEWRAVEEIRAGAEPARLAIVLGRGQFVSRQAMADIIEEEIAEAGAKTGLWPAARRWLADGAPPGATPATAMLASVHPGLSGLVADLQAIQPDFPVDQAVLGAQSDGDEDEEDVACHRALREAAQDSDVILTTHAMLAVDAMNRTRRERRRRAMMEAGRDVPEETAPDILPDRALLLIDEAHLYEDAQASIMSDGVSLFALRSHLAALTRAGGAARLKRLAAEGVAAADAAIESLREFEDDFSLPIDGRRRKVARRWAKTTPRLMDLVAALRGFAGEAKRVKAPGARTRRARGAAEIALRALTAFLDQSDKVAFRTLQVQFSAARRYPTLVFGPKNVRAQLRTLWESAPAAALFSATLYLPTKAHGVSALHMMTTLAVPQERAAIMPPVHPDWASTTPTLMFPDAAAARRLAPPSSDLEPAAVMKALSRWSDAAAAAIARIADQAPGGTLVLMTGYERARLVAGRLETALGDRLIEQTAAQSAAVCRTRFVELRRGGARPVWIGVGAAWTGLDLRDETVVSGADDMLLTDLVIPNVFNTTKSSTDMDREERFGFEAIRSKSLFTLRQGLGRLVRREGLRERRIWILDGRLARGDASLVGHRLVLDAYPKRATFAIAG